MTAPAPPDWQAPHLRIELPAPDWFHAALAHPMTSRFVTVDDCPIHYLYWSGESTTDRPGILFVHGGGAHANWWRFIAPLLTDEFNIAAIDLSGMGDSGYRETYSAPQRAREMRAVIDDAGLGANTVVVGHSFGGYMTMRFGIDFGTEVAGAVIVDSPIRHPDDPAGETPRRVLSIERHYPSFDIGLERFRLLPPQPCDNDFLVEFIARHSLHETERGWTWKFDVGAMGSRRWQEPFDEHFRNMPCRTALMYGQYSRLVTPETVAYMRTLLPPDAPVIEIAGAEHHVMLDQPQVFAAVLRDLLHDWLAEHRTGGG